MKNKLLNAMPIDVNIASLVLRVLLGGLMMTHGYMKLANYNMMLGMFTDIIGIGKELSLILVIFAEFFCAFFIVIGLFTKLSAIPVFITMFVAYFVAHANDAFDVKTVPFIYMILTVVIFFLGAGKYSLDQLIFKKRN